MRVVRIFGRLMLLAVIALVATIIYMPFKEQNAKSQALEFCDSIEVGRALASAEEAVKGVGEDRLRLRHDHYLTVGFTGIPPFSRHLCYIDHDGQRVTATRYVHMD
jgi:hypothetical protein